ncbi:MAG TPA: PAS domain S-box protein, partial [Verrucomicrobiae bacterium]|nr:PAS domain S-box protein [Verrucomicrobiae bacterium]
MPELHPGDRVEVVGTKLRERPLAPLIDWAEVRLVERGQPPPAPLLTETDILTGRHDCQRVRLRGRVLDFDRYPQGDTKVSRLIIQTGKQSAHAVFVGNDYVEFEAQPGNEVELTCVPVVSKGNTQLVRGFTMYLHDPSHVRVLPDPPAWRHPVIARVAGASAGMVGLALGWVWLLRRQVSKRTAALRESETRYRALFEHTGAAVVVTGECGELLFINSAALRMLGGDSPEAWRGKSPLNPAPGRAGAGTTRDSTRTPHPPTNHDLPDSHASFESTARRLDGSEIPVEVLLTPMTIDGRRVFQAIVTDITQRKKAESSLRQALDREKELGNLKTSFVSMVS